MRIVALLALAAMLAPAAAAAEPAYAFTDASLDASPPPANAWADVTGGRIEVVDATTLLATLDIAVLPEMRAGVAYGYLFTNGTQEWYAAAVMAPELHYYVGRWVDGQPETASDSAGSYTTGPGGSVVIEVPRLLFGNETELQPPRGMTADATALAAPVGVGASIVFLDEGVGTDPLVLAPREASEPASNATAPATPTAAEGARAGEEPAGVVEAAASPEAEAPFPLIAAIAAVALVAALARHRSR